jgi:hypothetical protein
MTGLYKPSADRHVAPLRHIVLIPSQPNNTYVKFEVLGYYSFHTWFQSDAPSLIEKWQSYGVPAPPSVSHTDS